MTSTEQQTSPAKPATGTVVLFGASDDLIELEGSIHEEFTSADDRNLVAFSDGTILAIEYTNAGVWRITTVVEGTAQVRITHAPEDDDDNYTDRAEITGDVWWAAHASSWAKAK